MTKIHSMRILITGASGNIGKELVQQLNTMQHSHAIYIATRETNAVLPYVTFDFNNVDTWPNALHQTDVLFLLRPPNIANINGVFAPIIRQAEACNVQHVVFLSVQGADTQTYLPHAKIEKLLSHSTMTYTFLRPTYFMQNFTTTFLQDIVTNNRIVVPAGNAPFGIVDVKDIAKVAAQVLINHNTYINAAFDITSNQNLSFTQLAKIIGDARGKAVSYHSPSLVLFCWQMRKLQHPWMYIFVLILLHYLPRFKKPPLIADTVKKLTGQEPNSFATFASQYASLFLGKT